MVLRTYGGGCPYSINQYVYTDDVNFNPNTIYSGTTWERVKGRVLVGVDESQSEFSTVKKQGGSKDMQSHKHATSNSSGSGGGNSAGYRVTNAGAHGDSNYWNFKDCGYSSTEGNGNSGNLQPYRTTYIWVRTK